MNKREIKREWARKRNFYIFRLRGVMGVGLYNDDPVLSDFQRRLNRTAKDMIRYIEDFYPTYEAEKSVTRRKVK